MKASTFLIFTGLLLTMAAVGGIETGGPILDCVLVAILGLSTMACGVLMLKVTERPVDNPTLW